MRRTGKDFVSPATAIEGCGRGGMTKDVAFMKGARRGFKGGNSVVALRGCAERRQSERPGIAVLYSEERRITPAAPQQIVMPAPLDDFTALNDQDRVGMHDGVKAMSDHDGGAVLAE